MLPDSLVHEILRRPGTLTFPSNLTDLPHLTAVAGSVSQQEVDEKKSLVEKGRSIKIRMGLKEVNYRFEIFVCLGII